ncbi:unnamed protein product [Symbiodinium sp. CCMP2456]|nr:unnamed protein product [Symbiodinium sp. CCMP2456]
MMWHKPLTASGRSALALNMLDIEACNAFNTESTWYTVHLLQTVDAKGEHYFKVGRTRSSCLQQRFHSYQMELLAVEPKLSLVCALQICLMSSSLHAIQFEGRIHKIMLAHKPELLLGAREKTREIYFVDALPYLKALFIETAAMGKDEFLAEMAQRKVTTKVFSGGIISTSIPDDATEAEETE